MYCKYCGAELSQDAKFCRNCGKMVVDTIDPFAENPNVVEYTDPFTDEITLEPVDAAAEQAKSNLGKKILTNAIVGLALGLATASIFVGMWAGFAEVEEYTGATICALLALVVNVVALCITGKARRGIKQYINLYGETNGKASVGKGLSIPANIVNIFLTVFDALILLASCSMIGY